MTQMDPNQTTQQTAPTKAPQPTLEDPPEAAIPEFEGNEVGTPDVLFVLDCMSKCIASKFAHGGDTRYVAQSAFASAREALGVLVAAGVVTSATTVRINGRNEPLWKNPSVPPMGQSARPVMG